MIPDHDWSEIWQERGPLEDLFYVASTNQLAVLLEDWPFGCGRFYIKRFHPSEGLGGPRILVCTILYTGKGTWMKESATDKEEFTSSFLAK